MAQQRVIRPKKSGTELLGELVIRFAVLFAIDAFAAWLLMQSLQGLHLRSGFWACYGVLAAVSIACGGGRGSGS